MNEKNLEVLDLNQQGIALFQAGNIEAAKEKYEKAIDIEPMVADSYKNLGNLYLRMEQYQEAKNIYKKALLIEKSGEVYFQYGNACFLSDEPHEGLEAYNLALTAGFDNDEMLFFMGMAYQHMGDNKMALRYIQKAMVKNPSKPDYKVKKIELLLNFHMMEEAKNAIDELLISDPELYDGYHLKTAILLDEKEYEQAWQNAKTAAERFPEDADLMFDYAYATALAGKQQEALKVLNNAKQMKYFEMAKPKFTLLEAQIYAERGNIEVAVEKCQQCISFESENIIFAEARFMLINLLLVQEDFETALLHANIILEHGEEDSYYFSALYYKPFCLKKLNRIEEAKAEYKTSISLYRLATLKNTAAFDAYLYRVMCLRDTEQYEEALELLDFFENLTDEIAEIYTLRADIYNLTDKKLLAKEELEKAYKIKPELRARMKEED